MTTRGADPPRGLAASVLRRGHWLRLSEIDAAITIAIIAWAASEAIAIDNDVPMGARLAFALAVSIPMVVRNRLPAAAFGVAVAAFLFDTLFEVLPLFAVTPLQLLPLTTYALASLGRERRLSGFVALAAVVVMPMLFIPLVDDAPVTPTDVISLLVVQTVAAGAGWAVRLRREEAERQHERLRVASAAGDDVVRHGLDEERARIARELRAIVARGLAAMEDGFGAGRGASGEALAAIAGGLQRRSAGVMAELQRLLGVLHEEEPGVAQPVSADGAISAARARGWRIDAQPSTEAVPGATLAAGRVVEEVFAAAPPADIARGADVTPTAVHAQVRVTPEGDGLRVRVSGRGLRPASLDDPVVRGSLRERVRLHGGTLRLVRRRRRWLVDVHLPGAGTPPAPLTSHLLGDAVVVGTASLVVFKDAQADGGAGPWVSAICGLLVFVLPLALRRRAPLAVVCILAGGLLGLELGDVLPDSTLTPIILALLGSGTAAVHLADRRMAIFGSVLVAISAVAVNLMELPPGEVITDTPIILFMVIMAYAFGRLVRESMERTQDARDSEELVEAEHASRLRSAIDDERRAVARDLHDVVAHGVSLAGVLAGAAQAQATADPVRARASLDSARSTVAQVRVEVQRLTAALGADDASAAPVDLTDLQSLVEAAARGGQRVTLALSEEIDEVPAGVGSSAYRIVQESLTNARKYAPGARVVVDVAVAHGSLVVVVANDAPPPGDEQVAAGGPVPGLGRGVAGMRERARLLGGELTAGPAAHAAYEVRARLPLGGE